MVKLAAQKAKAIKGMPDAVLSRGQVEAKGEEFHGSRDREAF